VLPICPVHTFDPISQVFLASVIGRKYQQNQLLDERVLLFFRDRDIHALDLPYLDGYYGRRLAEIHFQYQTPLAFLRPDEIFDILGAFSFEERVALGCYPSWTPHRLASRILLRWIRRRLRNLDFAFVEERNAGASVLRVSKEGEKLRVMRITGETLKPYAKLVDLIKQRIYGTGSEPRQLDVEHDFVRFFYPLRVRDSGQLNA